MSEAQKLLKNHFLLAWSTLVLPPLALLFGGDIIFGLLSLVFAIVLLIAFACGPTDIDTEENATCDETAAEQKEDSADKMDSCGLRSIALRIKRSDPREISNRLLVHMRRIWLGKIDLNVFAVFAFVGISLASFAWFADAIKERNFTLAFASVTYVFAIVLALDLYLVYGRKRANRKIFVTGISSPYARGLSREVLMRLKQMKVSKDDLVKMIDANTYIDDQGLLLDKPNFAPILAILAHPKYSTLTTVDLLIPSDTIDRTDPEKEEIGTLYLEVVKHLIKILNPGIKVNVKFLGKYMDEPVFAHDIRKLRESILRIYDQALRKHSEDFVFHITSGTSAMTAALVLVAVRGFAEGVYVRQLPGQNNGKDSPTMRERVVCIDLNVFDIADVVNA